MSVLSLRSFLMMCLAFFLLLLIPFKMQAASPSYAGKLLYTQADSQHLWYVSPTNAKRYDLGSSAEQAIAALKPIALGVTKVSLNKVPVSNSAAKGDTGLRKRLAGRFLLSVQEGGRLWYVNPKDLKRSYLLPNVNSYAYLSSLAETVSQAVLEAIPSASTATLLPNQGVQMPRGTTEDGSQVIDIGALDLQTINLNALLPPAPARFTLSRARLAVETRYPDVCEQIVTSRVTLTATMNGRVAGYFQYGDGFRTPELSLDAAGPSNSGEVEYRRQLLITTNQTTSNTVQFVATSPNSLVSEILPFETTCNRTSKVIPPPTKATSTWMEVPTTTKMATTTPKTPLPEMNVPTTTKGVSTSTVASVVATTDGGEYVASCSSTRFTFTGVISLSGPGEVRYGWYRSDRTSTDLQSFTATSSGSFRVTYQETLPAQPAGSVVHSSASLFTTMPNWAQSDAYFTLECPTASKVLPVKTGDEGASSSSTVTSSNWRDQAMLLPVTDFQREVRKDGNVMLSSEGGMYKVLLPNTGPNVEAYGRFALRTLKLNAEATQRLLGRRPLIDPPFLQRYVVDPVEGSAGDCCTITPDGYAMSIYFQTDTAYQRYIDLGSEANAWILERNWNVAKGDHELVHRFVIGTNLNLMLNEGLANYIPTRISNTEPVDDCQATGYRQSRTSDPLQPYFREGDPFVHRALYSSGECFWRLMERQYGADVITRIFSTRLSSILREDRTMDGPAFPGSGLNYSIRRLLVPVVGPSVWTLAAPFGASPTGI